jgi:RimJ/RimL family protein N-acetyltransferase
MSGAVFLDGDRVELRPAEPEDATFLTTTVNDHRVWEPMFIDSKFPTNRAEQEDWIREMSESDASVPFTIWADGDRVGSIGVFDIADTTGTAEISYFIAPDEQDNGYATDALTCLAGYAFDHLRLHKLRARTYAFNEASRGLLESVGFVEEGVHREEGYYDGEYRDVHYYGLLAPEFTTRH